MDDLDSLLQDLERATTNLKNNPGNPGGWKLNRPGDVTIASTPSYTSAKVVKHYSPHYYVPEEPLYQNESIRRSCSNASSHDYAAVNGRSTTTTPRTPTTPTSPMHEGSGRTTVVARRPQNASASAPNRRSPVNSAEYSTIKSPTDSADIISQKLSMLDSLLDDLNSARRSYGHRGHEHSASCSHAASTTTNASTLPNNRHSAHSPTNNGYASLNRRNRTPSPVNGGPNYMANGGSRTGSYGRERSDSGQMNDLLKDLEYSLQSPATNGVSSPVKSKTVTFENAAMQPKARSPSPTQSAQIQPVSEYNRNLVNIQAQHVRMNNSPVIQVPLPAHTTASNATRELDDLMASLSDFKMNQMKNQINTGSSQPSKSNLVALGRVQVPAKNGQHVLYRHPDSTDLDSMIGDLESDLNRHGVDTTTKGDCGACGRAIVGQVVTAMGKIYHPEHFTCAKCNTQLGNQSFFEREGLAYCEQDYHKLFSPKCNYCNQAILDRCITALDKTWHPEHFFCAHCGQNFGDDGYHEKAGNAYCREDFFKLFAPKCSGCAQPIVDNYVSALGGHWHSNCFVCRDCHLPFDGGNYFDIEGEPFCESHYHDKRGTLCATCRKPITGRCITAMFQKFHPEHFTCVFCLKQLNKGTFKKHQEKPYCHSCFDKLFA